MTVAAVLAGPVQAAHPARPAAWVGYLVALLVILAFTLPAMYAWWSLGRHGFGGDSNDDSDDGGSRRGRPPGKSPSGPGNTDPEWWPEFEREFAAHVAGQLRSSHTGRERLAATPEPAHLTRAAA